MKGEECLVELQLSFQNNVRIINTNFGQTKRADCDEVRATKTQQKHGLEVTRKMKGNNELQSNINHNLWQTCPSFQTWISGQLGPDIIHSLPFTYGMHQVILCGRVHGAWCRINSAAQHFSDITLEFLSGLTEISLKHLRSHVKPL